MEVKSKRHLRVRSPFDCEKGLPYTEIQNGDKRIENCTPTSPERTGLGLRLSNLALHKIKLVRRVPWILERISRNMNVPDSYPAEEELKEEKLKVDTLIIGSGLSGLFALNRTNGLLVTNELLTDIFDDPTNTNGELLHKSKEIIKSNADRIISGDFLGKFSEGYLVRTKGKIIMISPSRIVFAVGARYLPPIFEGNDYPNVISRRLYLKRISNYKKVIVLGSFDDAIKTALLSNAKILTPRGVRLFSKKYIELAENKGLEIEEVEWLRVKLERRKLSVKWEKGDQVVDALVFAPVKQPRLEAMANAGCDYKFYPNMGTYLPNHEMDGYMRSCGHFAVGGARGIWDEEMSALSGEAPFDAEKAERLANLLKETPLHQYYTNSLVAMKSPYFYSSGGYSCLCEDVLWKDVEEVMKMGYDNVELLKRVGGLGLGECQGKVCTYVTGSIISSQKLITFRSPLYPV